MMFPAALTYQHTKVVKFLEFLTFKVNKDNHILNSSRSGYEEENIYAKVDDMTYYPVISSQQTMPLPMVGSDAATLTKHHNIINNMMVTLPHAEQMESKTLNLHQANLQKQKDFNTFNAFSTVHRSQKIYL